MSDKRHRKPRKLVELAFIHDDTYFVVRSRRRLFNSRGIERGTLVFHRKHLILLSPRVDAAHQQQEIDLAVELASRTYPRPLPEINSLDRASRTHLREAANMSNKKRRKPQELVELVFVHDDTYFVVRSHRRRLVDRQGIERATLVFHRKHLILLSSRVDASRQAHEIELAVELATRTYPHPLED